jgi:hypothetical protein
MNYVQSKAKELGGDFCEGQGAESNYAQFKDLLKAREFYLFLQEHGFDAVLFGTAGLVLYKEKPYCEEAYD